MRVAFSIYISIMSSIKCINDNCDSTDFNDKNNSDNDNDNGNAKNFAISFSIDHILKEAGDSVTCSYQYQWLQCTRYYPPKIQSKFSKFQTNISVV